MKRSTGLMLVVLVCFLIVAFSQCGNAVRAKKKYSYGVYGGGPPYFEQVAYPTPVPEPECFGCAGAGLLLLIAIFKKKLKRKRHELS